MSGKYLVKMRYSVVFINTVFYTRRQTSYYEEQEAMLKNKEWEEEKRQQEAEKQIQENQRREMILKKREIEKEEFYRRLEESQKKFVEAQDNLEQVIQRQQFEKKVSFNDVVSAKVDLHRTGYFKIRFPQVINPGEEKQEEADKHKSVQKALAEMERREEELKALHDRDQLMKEEEARKRKEEMDQQIRGKILSSNR
jgi:biopolymer transport protein ExbD